MTSGAYGPGAYGLRKALIIERKDGTLFKFAVNHYDAWEKAILKRMTKIEQRKAETRLPRFRFSFLLLFADRNLFLFVAQKFVQEGRGQYQYASRQLNG